MVIQVQQHRSPNTSKLTAMGNSYRFWREKWQRAQKRRFRFLQPVHCNRQQWRLHLGSLKWIDGHTISWIAPFNVVFTCTLVCEWKVQQDFFRQYQVTQCLHDKWIDVSRYTWHWRSSEAKSRRSASVLTPHNSHQWSSRTASHPFALREREDDRDSDEALSVAPTLNPSVVAHWSESIAQCLVRRRLLPPSPSTHLRTIDVLAGWSSQGHRYWCRCIHLSSSPWDT